MNDGRHTCYRKHFLDLDTDLLIDRLSQDGLEPDALSALLEELAYRGIKEKDARVRAAEHKRLLRTEKTSGLASLGRLMDEW